MIVTGHDADFHHLQMPPSMHPGTEKFITVGLDFLVFGKKPAPDQASKRGATRIAFICEYSRQQMGMSMNTDSDPYHFDFVSGYANPTVFFLEDVAWRNALVPGAFDVVIVGSSVNYQDIQFEVEQRLSAAKAQFQAYFNQGGKLFVMIQESYAFLPKFGAAQMALTVGTGNFYTTRSGDSIGFESDMINQDPTHHMYGNVDTALFKIFERTRETTPNGDHDLPITIGFNGTIKDSIFVPARDTLVLPVVSTVPSGVFTDSVCVEFYTPSDGATLLYTLDGTLPATSTLSLPNHGRYCFRQTTTFRVLGKKAGWINSPDTTFTYFIKPTQPLQQVAKPQASIPSGTFPDSVCVAFTTATPGAALHSALEGMIPDSAAPVVPASGTLCFHQTTVIGLIGTKAGFKPSDTAQFTYILKKPPRPPSTLALYAEGKPIDVVIPDHAILEVRLTRAAGALCAGCTVQVTPSKSADRESLPLGAQGGSFTAIFPRVESGMPVPGDGSLQHMGSDSIVLVWINPEDPAEAVRRSYPYAGYGDIVVIRPQNTIAKTVAGQGRPAGPDWIISDAPGLLLGKNRTCCSIESVPVNAQNPDSLRLVGLFIEASRGFILDLKVFSQLGEFVSQVAFTVPETEFRKLGAGKRKGARFLRLLWNGTTQAGARAGNGVYIFKTAITLLPMPGDAKPPVGATASRRIGILRSPD